MAGEGGGCGEVTRFFFSFLFLSFFLGNYRCNRYRQTEPETRREKLGQNFQAPHVNDWYYTETRLALQGKCVS